MASLEKAIAIAAKAHAGQVDKAGAPYILHPLRVMLSLQSDDERIVGVLHDLVEDCHGWTFEKLEKEGFGPKIIKALKSVTKNDQEKNPVLVDKKGDLLEESYEDFVKRAAKNPIGARVKRADLMDNMDWSRIANPNLNDLKRMQRYKKAVTYLNAQSKKSKK